MARGGAYGTWATDIPVGAPKDTGEGAEPGLCGLSPENLRLQQEERIQKNAGCRMTGRCEDEELVCGLARGFSFTLRKGVGWQGGVKWEWRREKGGLQ